MDGLSFKLQELSSDAASCNISIFSIPNFVFIRNCAQSTMFNICKYSSYTNHQLFIEISIQRSS